MSYTGPFQLAPGSDLFSASEVDPAERTRVGCNDDDFLLTRTGSRSRSSVVDSQMAYVLTQFREPTRIVDAILSASEKFGTDPETTMDAVLPGLTQLIDDGFVVDAARIRSSRREPLPGGANVGGWVVVTVLQEVDDSEVYQVCRAGTEFAALKLCAPRSALGRRNIRNERAVLEKLTLATVPRLLDHGAMGGRTYTVIDWRRGARVGLVARELRGRQGDRRRDSQLTLCLSIANAYVDLHEAGIVHGDVHEGNLLLDSNGTLSILDFGIARDLTNPHSKPPRGAVGCAYEPEYAAAILADRAPPDATPTGEQFIVAGLLFELVTGAPYADFSYQSTRALQQVLNDQPRSFAECGAEPWPELEMVLGRALSKNPDDRYASMRAFARALGDVRASRDVVTPRRDARGARRNRALAQWFTDLASFTGTPSAGVSRAPTASVAYGAAGVAYALLRLARHEGSTSLLAAADVWAEHAVWATRRDKEDAFGDSEMSSASVGPSSLYFSNPGVHVVRALVGSARGDAAPLRSAARALTRCANDRTYDLDLGLGTPGVLLACALMLESRPPWSARYAGRLIALGDDLASRLWLTVQRLAPVARAPDLRNLGAAHGWGGLLYALLRWWDAAGAGMPNELHARCRQLAAMAEPIGRGARFPWRTESTEPADAHGAQHYMSGWCNGSAGFVHLWSAAWHAFHDPHFRELGEACAWNSWEDDTESDASLCCGLAGRAYALLAWYRHSGERTWLARANELVRRAIGALDFDEPLDPGLLKGHLSLALLQRELAQPHLARMPLFEPDAWSTRSAPR